MLKSNKWDWYGIGLDPCYEHGGNKTGLCMLQPGRFGGLAVRAPNKGGDWRGGL